MIRNNLQPPAAFTQELDGNLVYPIGCARSRGDALLEQRNIDYRLLLDGFVPALALENSLEAVGRQRRLGVDLANPHRRGVFSRAGI
jgi:hypothetical protein